MYTSVYTINKLYYLHRLHCEEDGRATTRLDLIAKLKAEYSCKTLTPREEKTRISEEESSGKVSGVYSTPLSHACLTGQVTEGTEESGDAFKGTVAILYLVTTSGVLLPLQDRKWVWPLWGSCVGGSNSVIMIKLKLNLIRRIRLA